MQKFLPPPMFGGWIFKPHLTCGLAANLLSVRIVSVMRNKLMYKLAGLLLVRSTAVGEVGTIRATGYPGTQE